jgi:hypothetical protein
MTKALLGGLLCILCIPTVGILMHTLVYIILPTVYIMHTHCVYYAYPLCNLCIPTVYIMYTQYPLCILCIPLCILCKPTEGALSVRFTLMPRRPNVRTIEFLDSEEHSKFFSGVF